MDYDNRLRKKNWEVRPVALDTARTLIVTGHYTHGAANTVTYLHGLFPARALWDADCAGIAWWIPPTKSAAQATFSRNWQGVLALSRFLIIPGIPKNAATFLLGASMRLIDRKRWPCLVTYADKTQGHTGTIYKACNWIYVGETAPEAVWELNGRQISRKAGPKTRTKAEMKALGAAMTGKSAKYKFIHTLGDINVPTD